MMDDDHDGVRGKTMMRTPSDAFESAHETVGHRLQKFLWPGVRLPQPINPALLEHERERAAVRQNRVADAITAFSGSMLFVYIHIAWFACWIGLGAEHYPFGLLTMIVSLEAIFLSTFVMISQNRADAKRQVIADEQWRTVKKEDQQNVELLKLSGQILALTQEVRAMAGAFRDQNDIAALTKEVRALRSSRGDRSE
jgi:uncharacterized membrane protein